MASITTSNSNEEGALQRLVALSSSLHTTLPLRQLVPIHDALLSAVSTTRTQEQSLASVSAILNGSEDDESRSILRDGEPARQLLTIQFLLYPVVGLQRLTGVLIPLLTQHFDAEGPSLASNEELREALLDAVFHETFANEDEILDESLLTGLSHAWVCRILVRLHTSYSSASSTTITMMKDLIIKHVLDSITATTSLEVLRPVTVWLLPLLYENEEAMQQVWTKCLHLVNEVVSSETAEQPQETSQTAMIASAILCTILPHLLETEVSCENDKKQLPLHQPLLWDFVSHMVQCGTKVEVKGGSFQFGNQAPVYQILRRRGLYLLRLIAPPSSVWAKYVVCYETLEMEQEQHLMDQVWDAVTELCLEASSPTVDDGLPLMTWNWIAAMLSRLFLSETPVLRKLVLYRFLNGHVGIQIQPQAEVVPVDRKAALQKQPKKKHSIKSKKKSGIVQRAPLSLVSTDFVLDAILPSFDTLSASVGTNMQFEHNGKIQSQDMAPKSVEFVMAYVACLTEERLQKFLAGVLSSHVMCRLRPRTVVMIMTAVADALSTKRVPITQEALDVAIQAFHLMVSNRSIVITYKEQILNSFATILAASKTEGQLDPKTVLRTLALFPLDLAEADNASIDHPTYQALKQWISMTPSAADTAAACASAFVQSQLMPSSEENWDPVGANSDLEHSMGGAIVLMAALSSDMASSLLWPAVHKGLSTCPSPTMAWLNAKKAARALILLENGCRLEILSGMGNGDLVVDQATQQMMPPPPTIEVVLANAVGFLLSHIRALASLRKKADGVQAVMTSGSTRSGNTNRISANFAQIIEQLNVLTKAYPSSMSVSSASEEMLESSIKTIMLLNDKDSIDVVTFTSLSYAALSSGANPWFDRNGTATADVCAKLLRLDFIGTDNAMSRTDEQTARSVFHFARWGCLSIMLPALLEKSDPVELKALLEQVFETGLDLVEATPIDALLPLFDSVRVAGTSWLTITGDVDSYPKHLNNIINAMFAAMTDVSASSASSYMLNEICALIFRPSVLFDEYERLGDNPDYEAPIRAAFLKMVTMAGTVRSYILKAVMCHICAGWLGTTDKSNPISAGLSAIPYVKEVVELLVHKEMKLDESSTNQSQLAGSKRSTGASLTLPVGTDTSSFARGFLLVFLSSLPSPNENLDPKVLTEFLHPVIMTLLNNVCYARLKSGNSLMTGTKDYCIRLRSWQALCILCRFVTADIAEEVSDRVFETLNQSLHGQIRYFIEMFGIQSSRMHPSVFVTRFVKEISRTDLALQQVSSLMVVGGNIIVGKYKIDFFSDLEAGEKQQQTLHEVLSGVIPWLSSTQGFSRAIAQIFVHALIPLVVDVTKETDDAADGWYLRNLYNFLDTNSEMKRLRKKQMKVFEKYDVDHICTVKGMLSIRVDEGGEANPINVVDVIKKCLTDVYVDAHDEAQAPLWKQRQQMLLAQQDANGVTTIENDTLVNFQRKIIPLDALNLAVEESREKRLRNAMGRKRQSLVICASLIDKIPNLGGLARTAEIFAADRLVIPDKSVVKMDNFKSISVGAGDWIQIEECNEENLLSWLVKKQEEGYTIVGLEQTSSSVSIENYQFPEKTVLLLGKEKEGIPVEFLQLVDQCVEIPQLGIIRSLNVHVSGAICIWEYSKQLLTRSSETS